MTKVFLAASLYPALGLATLPIWLWILPAGEHYERKLLGNDSLGQLRRTDGPIEVAYVILWPALLAATLLVIGLGLLDDVCGWIKRSMGVDDSQDLPDNGDSGPAEDSDEGQENER